MSESKKKKIYNQLKAGAMIGVTVASVAGSPVAILADELGASSNKDAEVVKPQPTEEPKAAETAPVKDTTSQLNEAGGTAKTQENGVSTESGKGTTNEETNKELPKVADSVGEQPKQEEPKQEEPKKEEPKQNDTSKEGNQEAPKGETPKVEEPKKENPTDEVKPKEPKEEKPEVEQPKPTIHYTLDGKTGTVSEGSKPLDLTTADTKKLASELRNNTDKTVTYKQVLPDGTVVPVKEDNVLPITSKLVGVYKDSEGKEHELTVANITSTKEYTLETNYSEDDGKLGFLLDKNQLLSGDLQKGTYSVLLNGKTLTTVTLEDGNLGGIAELANKLPEGTHTVFVEGVSKYGIKSIGSVVIKVKAKEKPQPEPQPEPQPQPDPDKPVVPTPQPSPNPDIKPDKPLVPNPDIKPNPDAPVIPNPNPKPNPLDPLNPSNPENPLTPSPSNPLVPTPNPTEPVTPTPPKEEPKKPEAPVIKEAPKGIKDITVGDTSLYGEANRQQGGVASNSESTTFTESGKVDLRVSVDTNVVDTSRTEIKLVGRSQGELNSADFVELKDGTYRLKGLAKDDYYTLTVKTYDRNGKLVSDTVEHFSINKHGSKYSIENKNVEGKSFKSLKSDLKILESNVDKINTDKTDIKVYRNGKLITLPRKAVRVSRSGGVDSNWKYTYTVDKSVFKEDGVYTIEVFSQTETGVKYNSTKKTIQFTVDNHGPEISITGIRDGGRYKSNDKRITVDIRDISNLKSVKGYLNGKEVHLSYDSKTGLYYYDMKSSGQDKNDFTVEATDEAGNVSTQTVKGFLLSADLAFSIFNDDNLYYLLGGIGAAVVGFFGFLAFRRKRTLDEEDRLALEQAELLAASHSSGRERSTQVKEFSETTGSDRIKVEEVLPSSGQVLSVSTEDLPDEEVESTDSDETTVLSTEEVDVNEDEEKTDVIPEEHDVEESEDDKPTDIIQEESNGEEIADDSEDSKPTDVVSE